MAHNPRQIRNRNVSIYLDGNDQFERVPKVSPSRCRMLLRRSLQISQIATKIATN